MIDIAIWVVTFQMGGLLGFFAKDFQAQIVCEAKARNLAVEAHNCSIDIYPGYPATVGWNDFKSCRGFKVRSVVQKLGPRGFYPNIVCVEEPKGASPELEIK